MGSSCCQHQVVTRKCLHRAASTLRGAAAAAAAGDAAAVARARRRPAENKTRVRNRPVGWRDRTRQRGGKAAHTPERKQLLLYALVVLDLGGDGDGHRPAPDGADKYGRFAASVGGTGRKRK